MRRDERLQKMAANVMENSVQLKKGEKVYIEAFGESTRGLFVEFIKKATEMGATPFYMFNDNEFLKNFMENAEAEQVKKYGEMHKQIMDQCDAYVAVRGYDDLFMMADISKEKMDNYSHLFYTPVHFKSRIPNTKWCVMRYPNNTMAAMSKMSTTAFEDFYFKACLLDYQKMGEAQTALQDLMKKTDKVRIISPNTDLSFSIKGIGANKSCGHHNLPDGEVFSAPVKDSINGVIQFNTETMDSGLFLSNVRLEFENGRIVKASSLVNNDKLQELLEIDAGVRYMGEFAIGLNPHITKPMLDILFDEKIAGSLHMAIGNSYDDLDNGNKSAVHWDMVLIQTPEWGGGEIWFDDVLIRKDGRFVVKELEHLNPENLA